METPRAPRRSVGGPGLAETLSTLRSSAHAHRYYGNTPGRSQSQQSSQGNSQASTSFNASQPAPLPELQPRAYPRPAFLLGGVQGDENADPLLSLVARDVRAATFTLSLVHESVSDLSRGLGASLADSSDRKRQLEFEVRTFGEQAKSMTREGKEIEGAMKRAEDKALEVRGRQREVREGLESAKADLNELKDQLARVRKQKEQDHQSFLAQSAQLPPLLAFYERYTGLSIRGVPHPSGSRGKGKEQCVEFRFDKLDPNNYSRGFGFVLDIGGSEEEGYSLVQLTPENFWPVARVRELLTKLNNVDDDEADAAGAGDLFEFVRGMRGCVVERLGGAGVAGGLR